MKLQKRCRSLVYVISRSICFLILLLVNYQVAAAELDDQPGRISFINDIQPVFNRQCVQCHTADDHMGELILEDSYSYQSLVNVPAMQLFSMRRVAPGNPKESYLMHKLEDTQFSVGGSGWIMPPKTHPTIRLTPKDIQVIRTWVSEGARDN